MVEVEIRPMKAGTIAENIDTRNLIFGCGLQALQIFAWNQVPAAIAQLRMMDSAWSRPIFHFRHPAALAGSWLARLRDRFRRW